MVWAYIDKKSIIIDIANSYIFSNDKLFKSANSFWEERFRNEEQNVVLTFQEVKKRVLHDL